ncbi:MAG TPA: maleylpyruvate isomerase N-terminal domain-containing protein [Chloroflexota bacterium]|jgi:uncharacterized damage-inducible protein DinB
MRHTREEVLERTQREFDALDGLVAQIDADDWHRPVPRPETRDPWTIKDALAHIVYWKLHTVRVIRGERRPPELRGMDVPRLNQHVYEEWRERAPEDVIGWHRQVHVLVLQALTEKPREWFGQRERGPGWPGDLDGHSAAHRQKDIERALAP